MSEHHSAVTVKAPAHQVYSFFSHFNDFPKFMHFVKEVTYYDEQRSHWVVQMGGTQEWDAVNEDWVPDRQIGWRSTSGLQNRGMVKFTSLGPDSTQMDVYLSYTPPSGMLGTAVEHLGFASRFDASLQRDLDNFARMVEQAPQDALDPMQSHYLFHDQSAVAGGRATERQNEAMAHDPHMQSQARQQRDAMIARESAQLQKTEQENRSMRERDAEQLRSKEQKQSEDLRRQEEIGRQQNLSQEQAAATTPEPHPVYDTLGGRNAAMERAAIGDRDARGERFPGHEQDPMISRAPGSIAAGSPALTDVQQESPWNTAIHGQYPRDTEGDDAQGTPSAQRQSTPETNPESDQQA